MFSSSHTVAACAGMLGREREREPAQVATLEGGMAARTCIWSHTRSDCARTAWKSLARPVLVDTATTESPLNPCERADVYMWLTSAAWCTAE